MKLKKLVLENFKAYKNAEIDFDNIGLIVGKNDAGKSTILHALNLFFNPKDANRNDLFYKNNTQVAEEIAIECHFDVTSGEIKLGDEDNEILITETNLLNKEKNFVLGYKYTADSLSKSPYISSSYVKCHNYDVSRESWSSSKKYLEQMNQTELNKAIENLKITPPDNADGRENHGKRKAIEKYIVENNQLEKSDIDIELGVKQDKESRLTLVIDKLPKFKLFSNDKANSMEDKENSSVIENLIKVIIKDEILEYLNDIMQSIMAHKIAELSSTYKQFFGFLGDDSFTSHLCSVTNVTTLDEMSKIDFKTNGIKDSNGLNIENRGSGFRRLALLSLHLSAYEEEAYEEEEYKNMIFAIEEPETSQNPHNQRGIIDAVRKLTEKGSQVIITTHSPAMAKEFSGEDVKYTVVENCGAESRPITFDSDEKRFEKIIELLGILPLDTHGKKLIVFVEGIHDQAFLTKVGKDVYNVEDILFVPVGGKSNLSGYIAANIFKSLQLSYGGFIDKLAANDKSCEKMKESLKNLGYENNIIQTKLDDISKYLKDCATKKDLHSKIQGMQITKENLEEEGEIAGWFNKFQQWKNNTSKSENVKTPSNKPNVVRPNSNQEQLALC
jgi:putative ATP-dependent endonuclease of OLD family